MTTGLLDLEDLKALDAVPSHLRNGLRYYIEKGVPVGGFLTAVLENNLSEAFAMADESSRAGMFEIVSFLYNHAPYDCWGSPGAVKTWVAQGGLNHG